VSEQARSAAPCGRRGRGGGPRQGRPLADARGS